MVQGRVLVAQQLGADTVTNAETGIVKHADILDGDHVETVIRAFQVHVLGRNNFDWLAGQVVVGVEARTANTW